MPAAVRPSSTELHQAIARFVDDFQSIIRVHVTQALQHALGKRPELRRAPRQLPKPVAKRRAPAKRSVGQTPQAKAKATSKAAKAKRAPAKAARKRPEQLNLF